MTIFLAALAVLFGLGFFATLVGASQQVDDLLRRIDYRDARIEDLENEVRWLQRRNHPAGRALALISEERREAVRISRDRDGFTGTRRFAAEHYAGGLAEAARILRDADALALREALEDRDAGVDGA